MTSSLDPLVTTTTVSPLFVDHSNLSTYTQAVDALSFQTPGPNQSGGQRFWSTEARAADSPVQETLEISLSSTRLVNWIKYDVSQFPHTLQVQYFDAERSDWVPMLTPAHTPIRQTITRSIPIQLPNPAHMPGHLHPQHSFLGHWHTVQIQTLPTFVQKVRLVLQRLNNGLGPVDVLGAQMDYSLGVRLLSFGYQVTERDDVPRMLPHDETYQRSFASTEDLLGSSVSFALRDPVVSRIADNTDADADAVWVCEPQPYPGAVVCLYVDLRDSTGRPQLVHQIFIDPINCGAHATVYWSLDQPVGDFDAAYAPLDTSTVAQVGQVRLQDGRLDFGEYGTSASLTIPNIPVVSDVSTPGRAVLGYDPTLPWWLGVVITPGFNQGVDQVEHPIIDCGVWRLSLSAAGLTLTTYTTEDLSTPSVRTLELDYDEAEDISAVLSYDGRGTFRLRARTVTDQQQASFTMAAFGPRECPTVALGADLSGSFFLNCSLSALVLKEELHDDTDDFLDHPDSYCTVALFAADDLPQSRSALLRLDPGATSRIDTEHPYGLFGGVATKYENLVWQPVPRDFILQRGWMQLLPTKARFLKLEFTNLQAIPYDIAVQGPQRVKTFPPEVLNHYRHRLTNTSSSTAPRGIITQFALPRSANPYEEAPLYISSGGNGNRGYTNTEVWIADDYTTGQRLRALRGEDWGYQTFHVGHDAPRFYGAQRHRYTEETITRTGKIAYQVGLRQISFARSSFTAPTDNGVYDEPFYSQHNLVEDSDYTNITYDEHLDALTSGGSAKAVATSLVYSSRRDVRAVQFSVQQTPAAQILPDDEFSDPALRNWDIVGDASLAVSGLITSSVFGSLLPLTRNLSLGYWGDIEPVFHTWGGITTLGLNYGDLRSKETAASGAHFGGVASHPVPQPPGGRLYAAARVVADRDLSGPLSLQIKDAITQETLAERSVSVKADQVTEWSVGCTLGEGPEHLSGELWGELSGAYLDDLPSMVDVFSGDPDAAALSMLNTGQLWQTPSTALALVAGNAVVESPAAISWVDTLTPWGTLSVLLGTTVSAATDTASVPLLYLGYLRLMNDGRVIDVNTARTLATVPGLADDDGLEFDFMPTSMIPTGQRPAGVDPTVAAWGCVISRNGAYVASIATVRAFGTLRGLSGEVGQRFQAMTWVPRAAGIPPGEVIAGLPMPQDGALDDSGTIWIQGDGHTWNITDLPVQSPSVPPTFTASPRWQGNANTITAPAFTVGANAPPPPSRVLVATSTGTGAAPGPYGTLTFRINQLAATVPSASYPIAYLDTGVNFQLLLLANGDLVRQTNTLTTVLKVGAVPPASMVNTDLSIKFVKTATLSAAFQSTYAVSPTHTQALIFLVNDAVVGVYSGIAVFASNLRGIFGYNDNAGHHTVTTGFAWSTDAAAVSTGVATGTGVSWGEVSQNATATYADLAGSTGALNLNPVYVQCIQQNASTDAWYQDTLSLFSDPIVWEFSNDGGKNWMPGFEVANDPNAAVAFPAKNPADRTAVANRLCYRVTIWAPDYWVSHLAIRPWYEGFLAGPPPRLQGSLQGPNINPWDHYPPIEYDPRWKIWHLPIPRDWWFAFRSINSTPRYVTPYVSDSIVVRS